VLHPFDPLALMMKAAWLERAGQPSAAAQAYQAALTVVEQEKLSAPELQPLVAKAQAFVAQRRASYSQFLDAQMAKAAESLPHAKLDRFRHSLDIHLGRRKRFDTQPLGFYFAHLAPVEFFDRARFPWIPALEAGTAAIRGECVQALRDPEHTEPYLTYDQDQPLQQWAELNRNPAWSAYHLLKQGRRVEPNASRCPATLAALATVPQPVQSSRTPVAMFSLLNPHTHIPPHTGISNVRLVAHLPLIVPPDCALRVGSDVHVWREGEACIFDDTIEHEAWNRSDALRAVLIFDVWHPDLTSDERALVTALAQAMDDFGGESAAMPL
jgi:aspartate beta-hydroxylase